MQPNSLLHNKSSFCSKKFLKLYIFLGQKNVQNESIQTKLNMYSLHVLCQYHALIIIIIRLFMHLENEWFNFK